LFPEDFIKRPFANINRFILSCSSLNANSEMETGEPTMLFFPVFLFMTMRIYELSGMQYTLFLEYIKDNWYRLSDETGSSKTRLSFVYKRTPESIVLEGSLFKEILLSKTESALVPTILTTRRQVEGRF